MKTVRLLRGIALSLSMCILSVMSAEAQETNMAPVIESMIRAFKSMKADTVRKDVIEPNLYRAFYKAEYHPVAKSMAPAYEWTQVLQIGETAQRFIDYGTLLADSIFDDGVKTGKAPEEFVPGYHKAGKSSVMDSHILFLQREGKMEYFDRIIADHFTYIDSIPQQQWELVAGDSIIAGYTCHRAQTRYRGRDYTAWYTEEIPLSYGPYKFRGLPGLITCIYDKDRDHVFTLQGFERAPLGEVIYRKKKSYFKTTRARLQQAIRNYMANPSGYSTPKINVQGKKTAKPPKPYNPIELE